jgi:hypothetical protein
MAPAFLQIPRLHGKAKQNHKLIIIRGPFEKFVDWRQCATVMQREAVTIMPSCSGGGNVVIA